MYTYRAYRLTYCIRKINKQCPASGDAINHAFLEACQISTLLSLLDYCCEVLGIKKKFHLIGSNLSYTGFPSFFSALIHIWTYVDGMKLLSQTCLGALCELWIQSQSKKLIIITSSVVLGIGPGSLHGLKPIHYIHSPHIIQGLWASYHSPDTFHLTVPCYLLPQHLRYQIKLWTTLLNPFSRFETARFTEAGRRMNQLPTQAASAFIF